MKNEEFYKILDGELQDIIDDDIDGEVLEKLKQPQQKKSYAFLVWFLKFYSGIDNVASYITEGHDDNSCDIILDRTNSQGEKTFYLIQSKWNSISNCNGELEKEILQSYLSDVYTVLRGDKQKGRNSKFNSRYDDLLAHIRKNGGVKILYLTLKNRCKDSASNIRSIEQSIGGNTSVEGFDINRIKMDYISRYYKKSTPPNPLDKVYNPEYEKIVLNVLKDDENNHLKIDKPFEAHVFNIRPKTIYNLVERYGVSLFEKNVRNPLNSSSINAEIKNSLLNNPSYFWYYNNGITAISRLIPSISNQAESFEVVGLQIINGAQTAYSVYLAYLDASPEQREIIDAEAKITLRLLKSGGKDFDLKVTRYTNSQNPVSDRDFWSSDDVQEKIQEYFYDTSVWYERRSGEFRKVPKGVIRVPNTYIANAYLSFWLTDPISVFEASVKREHEGVDLIFTSHKDNKEGLYEKIFNKYTSPNEVFASFCMFDILTNGKGFDLENVYFTNGFHILALSKIIMEKYLQQKFGSEISVVNYIERSYENEEFDLFKKCLMYSSMLMRDEMDCAGDSDKEREVMVNLLTKRSHFDILVEKISKVDVDVERVESLDINDESDFEEFNDEDVEAETLH